MNPDDLDKAMESLKRDIENHIYETLVDKNNCLSSLDTVEFNFDLNINGTVPDAKKKNREAPVVEVTNACPVHLDIDWMSNATDQIAPKEFENWQLDNAADVDWLQRQLEKL